MIQKNQPTNVRCDYPFANKGVYDFFVVEDAILEEHEDELWKNGFF